MEHWIERFGYLAVLVDTFIEGEAVLVAGGFMAGTGRPSISMTSPDEAPALATNSTAAGAPTFVFAMGR